MVLRFRQLSLSRQLSLASITGLALLALCAPVWAVDGRVQGIRYDAATRHFQIDSAGNVKATVNTLNIAGHKRIIIDMDNAEIGTELPRDVQILHDLSRQLPALKNVTVNQYAGSGRPIVRILMDIQGDPGTVRLVRNQGSRIELELNESASAPPRNNNNYAQPPSLSRLDQPVYQPNYQPVYKAATSPVPTYAPQQQPVQSNFSDVDLRRTLAILNQKYENLGQENQYLKARLNSVEQGQASNQYMQQRDRDEQARLKAELDQLRTTNTQLRNQLDAAENAQRQPDPALASKQAEVDRLKSENQTLNTRQSAALAAPKGVGLDEMKLTIAEMNRRYDTLARENQSLRAKLNAQSDLSVTVSASQAQVSRLTQEKQALSSENARLKSELAASEKTPANEAANQAELNRLAQEKQTLRNENVRLKSELDANANAKARNATSQAELDRLAQEKQTLRNENVRLKSELDANANAKARNATSQAELDRLAQEKQTLRNENVRLKSELDANANAKARNATSQAELDRLAQEKQTLRNENARLKSELAASEAAKGNNGANQAELNRLAQEKQTLSSENSRLKSELATLSSRAPSISETDMQVLRRQLTVAQSSMSESIRTINEQNKEIAYLRNQVSDVKAGMDASSREQVGTLQSRLSEKDTTIQALQRQLAAKSSVVAATPSNSSEVSSLKLQLDKLNQQYQRDMQELNRQLQDKNDQRVASGKQSDQVESLQQQVRNLNNQLADATAANRKALAGKVPSDEVQKREAQIASLQSELNRLKSNQDDAGKAQQVEIASLQQDNSRLKATAQSGEAARKQLAETRAELEKLKLDKTKKAPVAPKNNPVDLETIAQLNRDKQTLRDELDTLKMIQQQASADTEKNHQLENQVASLKSDLSSLKTQNDQLRIAQSKKPVVPAVAGKVVPAVAGKVDPAAQTQVATLNKQLADLRKENTSLRDNLSAAASSRKSSAPNSEAELSYTAAKADLNAKKLDTALDKFKNALLLDPDNSRYSVDYSIALAEDHQYAEAIDVLRTYLQRNPGDREVYNQLGKIYLLNDQPDAANQAFTRAIPISVLNNYATSLKKLGNTADAESVFKLALTLNPKDSEVLFNLGNLYNSENKLEQARNKYLEALQIRPDFAEAHYNVGLIFSKMGDNPKAVGHLEKFLQLSPNARNAETIRAYVQKLKA